jgi:hypothetical protein
MGLILVACRCGTLTGRKNKIKGHMEINKI